MPTNFKDYYQILQVHFDASPDVIKAAYRKLCTLYHPDTLNDHYASQRIQDINEAYAVLGNSEKRSLYHKEWLTKYTNRNQHAEECFCNAGDGGIIKKRESVSKRVVRR